MYYRVMHERFTSQKRVPKMDDSTTELVYIYICTYIEDRQMSPTYREIAKGCFISKSAVEKQLIQLEAQNRIQRIPGASRSIRPLQNDDDEK
jgi:SOS-response transcriptional repressor LexA